MTRVFVADTSRRIAPFGDAPGDVPIANRPLKAWQDEAFSQAGLQRIATREPPCLVVPDTLFTTGAALRAFVDGAAGRNAVLALRQSEFGRRTTPLQPDVHPIEGGWRFDAVRFDSGASDEPAIVWVDPDESTIDIDLPPVFRDADAPSVAALPRDPVMTLHHWAHILWANQAAGSVEMKREPRWRVALKVIWAILRARSLNKWRVLGKLNTVGKGCDIHPTAVVEGCTLGDGVEIGPHARVRFSRLGDGVKVMPGAQVELSTLGHRAQVAQNAALRLCVLYEDAFFSQSMLQASVVGRDTLMVLASYCIDLNLDRNIRVELDGQLLDSGTRFLGCAVGHRARLGTGIWLASGRAVPNDAVLVRAPEEVISRVPDTEGDPGPWIARHGTLERAGETPPKPV